MTANKDFAKKSKEKCPEDCRGRMMGPDKYCPCIERQLPKKNGGLKSIKFISSDKIEDFPNQNSFWKSSTEESIQAMESALRRCGLADYETKLLMSRFVEEKTLKEIMIEQGWLNAGSVLYHIRMAIKKLRACGFKFK